MLLKRGENLLKNNFKDLVKSYLPSLCGAIGPILITFSVTSIHANIYHWMSFLSILITPRQNQFIIFFLGLGLICFSVIIKVRKENNIKDLENKNKDLARSNTLLKKGNEELDRELASFIEN